MSLNIYKISYLTDTKMSVYNPHGTIKYLSTVMCMSVQIADNKGMQKKHNFLVLH